MRLKMNKQYVLLDRDGTIIVDKHYLSNPDEVELLPNAILGLQKLSNIGLGLIVISNQSGVSRGFFNEEQVHIVNKQMETLLINHNIHFDKIYYHKTTIRKLNDLAKKKVVDAYQKNIQTIEITLNGNVQKVIDG